MKKIVALSLIFLPLFLKCAESAKSSVNPEVGQTIQTIGTILKLRMAAQQNPDKRAVITDIDSLQQLNSNMNHIIRIYNGSKDSTVRGMISIYFEGLSNKKRSRNRFSKEKYNLFLSQEGNTDAMTAEFTDICSTWEQREILGKQLTSLLDNPSSDGPDNETIFNTMLQDMSIFQHAADLDSAIVASEIMSKTCSARKFKKLHKKKLPISAQPNTRKESIEQRIKYNRKFTFWTDPALAGATHQQLSYAKNPLSSDSLRTQVPVVATLLKDVNNVYTLRQELELITQTATIPTDRDVLNIDTILAKLNTLYDNIQAQQDQISAAVDKNGKTCLQAVVCGLLPSFIQRKQ